MSLQADGRRGMRPDVFHLQSIHPDIIFPISTTQAISTYQTGNFEDEVAAGKIAGQFPVSKWGKNLDIDGPEEDVWSVGGTRAFISTPSTIEAISTNNNDIAGGSGARQIDVSVLDDSFNYQSVLLNMNGTAATTASTTLMYRINRSFVSVMGTYGGNNLGDITIRISGAGATLTEVLTGIGQTEQSHYSVANGYRFHLKSYRVSTDATKTINATLWWLPRIHNFSSDMGAKRKIDGFTGLQGSSPVVTPSNHIALDGPCDIWWSATSAAQNTEVEAWFNGKVELI